MLLDTHFLVWTALGSDRLRDFPWLAKRRPWVVSPVSLLEIRFLSEVGKLRVSDDFFDMLHQDSRYVVDEPGLDALINASLPLSWTRDPFDRLICAHSLVRRMPLCSNDRAIRKNHPLIADKRR